jgi:membrane protein DedA with SNARE-associated domain
VQHFIAQWGYLAVFLLSVAESACVPFPSEVTLTFGGALAAEGRLVLGAVILLGALGETAGGIVAWAVGRFGGRPLVERAGRFVLVSPHDLEIAERWLARRGSLGVLVGRVVPVVRTFQSLPAGVARMRLARFAVLTFLGSLLWDGALAGVGYGLGARWHRITHGFHAATVVLAVLVVAAVAVFIGHRASRTLRTRRSRAA